MMDPNLMENKFVRSLEIYSESRSLVSIEKCPMIARIDFNVLLLNNSIHQGRTSMEDGADRMVEVRSHSIFEDK